MRWRVALALGWLAAACSEPIPEAQLVCANGTECPDGWSCLGGLCCSAGHEDLCRATDGGRADAASPDGGSPDAGFDAGEMDAGPADGGPDGGSPDAGADGGASARPTQLALGNGHTCVLYDDGAVYCWGQNDLGQLGIGAMSTTPATEALLVPGLTDVVEISAGAGDRTCARTSSGEVLCWGSNDFDGLGDPTVAGSSPDPIPIALGGTAIGIGMGVAHGCAIMDDHSLRCWGRNATGAVGTGSTSASVGSPTAVAVVSNVVEVEGGFQHTCARRMDDTIRCWGGNARGQCGANPLDNPRLIAANPGISGARDLALGHAHTCVSHAGRVSCFGRNNDRELANGVLVQRHNFDVAEGLPTALYRVAAGGRDMPTESETIGFSFAVDGTGTPYGWGDNSLGQLGRGSPTPNEIMPLPVGTLTAVSHLETGGAHTCAIAGAAVYCWGANGNGQLGNRTETLQASPVRVCGLPDPCP